MPPDDELFPDDNNQGDNNQSTDDSTSEGDSGGKPQVSDQMSKAVEEVFGEVFKGLTTTLQNVDTRLGKMEQAEATRVSGGTTPSKETSPTEAATEIWEDPDKYIAEKAGEAAARVTGPLFQTLLEDKYVALENTMQGEVDSEFGKGVYDEMFREDVRKVVAGMPPQMRASENHFRSAVAGIKGMKFGDLVDKRSTHSKDAETEAVARRAAFVPLDGGRNTPKGGSLDPEAIEYIADLAKRGIDYTAKDYIRDRDAGDDVDTFPVVKQKGA